MDYERAFKIVKAPLVTEKSFLMMERENKLMLLVDDKATKREIKTAVEMLFDVEVLGINTLRTAKGKRAYVKLAPGYSATDIASRLGLV